MVADLQLGTATFKTRLNMAGITADIAKFEKLIEKKTLTAGVAVKFDIKQVASGFVDAIKKAGPQSKVAAKELGGKVSEQFLLGVKLGLSKDKNKDYVLSSLKAQEYKGKIEGRKIGVVIGDAIAEGIKSRVNIAQGLVSKAKDKEGKDVLSVKKGATTGETDKALSGFFKAQQAEITRANKAREDSERKTNAEIIKLRKEHTSELEKVQKNFNKIQEATTKEINGIREKLEIQYSKERLETEKARYQKTLKLAETNAKKSIEIEKSRNARLIKEGDNATKVRIAQIKEDSDRELKSRQQDIVGFLTLVNEETNRLKLASQERTATIFAELKRQDKIRDDSYRRQKDVRDRIHKETLKAEEEASKRLISQYENEAKVLVRIADNTNKYRIKQLEEAVKKEIGLAQVAATSTANLRKIEANKEIEQIKADTKRKIEATLETNKTIREKNKQATAERLRDSDNAAKLLVRLEGIASIERTTILKNELDNHERLRRIDKEKYIEELTERNSQEVKLEKERLANVRLLALTAHNAKQADLARQNAKELEDIKANNARLLQEQKDSSNKERDRQKLEYGQLKEDRKHESTERLTTIIGELKNERDAYKDSLAARSRDRKAYFEHERKVEAAERKDRLDAVKVEYANLKAKMDDATKNRLADLNAETIKYNTEIKARYSKDVELYKSATNRIISNAKLRTQKQLAEWDNTYKEFKVIEQEATKRLKVESDERVKNKKIESDQVLDVTKKLIDNEYKLERDAENRLLKSAIEGERLAQRIKEFEFKKATTERRALEKAERQKEVKAAADAAERAANAANIAAKSKLLINSIVTNSLKATKFAVVGPSKLVGEVISIGIINPLRSLRGIVQGIIRDSLKGSIGVVNSALSPIGNTIKNVLYASTIGIGFGIGQRIGQDITNGIVSAIPALNRAVIQGTRDAFSQIGQSVQESASVDKALITAKTLAPGGNDPRQIAALNQEITRVATDDNLAVTTAELADVVLQQAKAGRTIGQITNSLNAVARLITINAGTGEGGDAASISGDFLTSTAKFQLGAEQQVEALGLLQGAATSAKVELADLAQTLRYYSRSENSFKGFTESSILAALAAAGGQTGSTAGVGLNEIFNPKRVTELGKILNIEVADSNGALKEKVGLLEEIIKGYKNAVAAQGQLAVDETINKATGERGGRTLNSLASLISRDDSGAFNTAQFDKVISTVTKGGDTLDKLFKNYEDRIGKGFTAYENVVESSRQLIGRTFSPLVDGILLEVSNIIQSIFTPESLRPLTVVIEQFRKILDSKAGNDFIFGLKQILKDLGGAALKELTQFIKLVNLTLVSPKKSSQLLSDLREVAKFIKLIGRGIKAVITTELELGYKLIKGIISLSENAGFKKGLANFGEKYKAFTTSFVGLLKAIASFIKKLYDGISEIFAQGAQLASNFAVANGITFSSVSQDIKDIGSAIGEQLLQSGRNLKIVYGGVESFLEGLRVKDLIFNLSERLQLKLNSEDLGQWQKFSLTLAAVAGSILIFGANPITVFGGIAALLAQIPTGPLNEFATNAEVWGTSVRVSFLAIAQDIGLTVQKISDVSANFKQSISELFNSEGFKNFTINLNNELAFTNYRLQKNLEIARKFYAEEVFNEKNRELARKKFEANKQQFVSGASDFNRESAAQFPKDITAIETNFNTPGTLEALSRLISPNKLQGLKTTLTELKGIAVQLALPLVAVVEPIIRIGEILLSIVIPALNVFLQGVRQLLNLINFFLLPTIEFLNQGLIGIQLIIGAIAPSINSVIEQNSQFLTKVNNAITTTTNNMVKDVQYIFQTFIPSVFSNFAKGTAFHFFNIKSDIVRAFSEVSLQVQNYILPLKIQIDNFFYGIRVAIYNMGVGFTNTKARIVYDWQQLMLYINTAINNIKLWWANGIKYMQGQVSLFAFNFRKFFLYDIPKAIADSLNSIRTTFNAFNDNVRRKIAQYLPIIGKIKNAINLIFTSPYGALERLYNLAIKLVSPFSRIADALKSSADAINSAGVGVKNVAGGAAEKFSSAASAAKNFITGQNRSSSARNSSRTRQASATTSSGPQYVAVSSGAAGLSPLQNAVAAGVSESIKPYFQPISGGGRAELEQYLANDKVQRFLALIRHGEGTTDSRGYNRIFGGREFNSFANHPRLLQSANGFTSDAAGAYQFLSTTFEPIKRQYGLPDFGPKSQNLAAVSLLKDSGTLDLILENKVTQAVYQAARIWASLPRDSSGVSFYSDQPTKSVSELISVYKKGANNSGFSAGGSGGGGGARSLVKSTNVGTLSAQEYGASRDGGSRRHAGVDIDYGQEIIYNLLDGVVTRIGTDTGYGNYIDIYNKERGVVLRLAEADRFSVKLGDRVTAGQQIGYGTNQTGVIHTEIRTDVDSQGKGGFGFGGTVDPIKFLSSLGNIQRSGTSLKIFSGGGAGGSAGINIPEIRFDTSEIDSALKQNNSALDGLLKAIGGGISSSGGLSSPNVPVASVDNLNVNIDGSPITTDAYPNIDTAAEKQLESTTSAIETALKQFTDGGLTSDEIAQIKSVGGLVSIDGDQLRIDIPTQTTETTPSGTVEKQAVATATAELPELVKTLKSAFESRGISIDSESLLSINSAVEEEKKVIDTLPSSFSAEVIGVLQSSGLLGVGAVNFGQEFSNGSSYGESSLQSLQRLGMMVGASSGSSYANGSVSGGIDAIAQIQNANAKRASLSTSRINIDLSGLGSDRSYSNQDVATAVDMAINSPEVEREMFNRFIHRLANDPQARAHLGL